MNSLSQFLRLNFQEFHAAISFTIQCQYLRSVKVGGTESFQRTGNYKPFSACLPTRVNTETRFFFSLTLDKIEGPFYCEFRPARRVIIDTKPKTTAPHLNSSLAPLMISHGDLLLKNAVHLDAR